MQITSVGATTLLNSSIYGGEKAVASPNGPLSYYSGGGFSSVFPRPSWQSKAVSKYLDKYAPKVQHRQYSFEIPRSLL